MMKYENLMNKQYKEPENGKFEDATKEILEAVSGDSNTDYDKEMEPVAAIPAHLVGDRSKRARHSQICKIENRG